MGIIAGAGTESLVKNLGDNTVGPSVLKIEGVALFWAGILGNLLTRLLRKPEEAAK